MSVLLTVQDVRKTYGDEPVLVAASLEIRRGDRVALIGPNGAGKTTFLKILLGQLDPDVGEVDLAKGVKFGFLEQRPEFTPDQTVWEVAERAIAEIKSLDRQAQELAWKMGEAKSATELQELTRRFDDLQIAIEQRGGFQLDHKIERVLQGLGFTEEDYRRPARLLSGGEINRLMLGLLLLEEPDLMLLDEPSNHLDIAATEWLEQFLIQSKQAFLLVSHDRYFLDRVVTRTCELVNGTIESYPGNFTKYQTLKADRLLVQQRTYEKQQIEIAKIEDFIRRNGAGQKAAQAEDRRKKLERIERVELPREISLPPMRFPEPTRCGDIVLRLEDVSQQFGEEPPLFQRVNLQIQRGERWGILGPNGCGKSTLLKCVVGEQTPRSGKIQLGTGVRLGYFDQKLASVREGVTAAEAVRPLHKELVDKERRDLLAVFGITGDLALQPVESLSGGERNRVALARLSASDANFLVLDEPTNHLDLWSREALERALKDYAGTLLLVSHDRYFINQICTHLLVFRPDRVLVFEGNYESFRDWERAEALAQKAAEEALRSRQPKLEAPNTAGSGKKRKFPYRKVSEIEREIAEREASIEKLHFDLVNPEVLRNGPQVIALKQQLTDHQTQVERLYEHWQEAMELNG